MLAATPISAIRSLYDTSVEEEEVQDGWCPFCETWVKVGHRGYLMVCKSCDQRID